MFATLSSPSLLSEFLFNWRSSLSLALCVGVLLLIEAVEVGIVIEGMGKLLKLLLSLEVIKL